MSEKKATIPSLLLLFVFFSFDLFYDSMGKNILVFMELFEIVLEVFGVLVEIQSGSRVFFKRDEQGSCF